METSSIKFGKWEATTLLINLICTKIFLNYPRTTAEDAGTAGWILTIYISLICIVFLFFVFKLYSKFEGKDLLDISEYVGGKVGKIICGTIIIAFFLYITSVILREFAENMKVISFDTTPISVIMVFFLIGIVLSAYFGLETIVRINVIMVPIISIGFLLIIIAVLPFSDISNLFPILGTGTYNIFIKSLLKISTYSDLLVLFLIVPFIGGNETFKKIGYTAIGISAIFLTLSVITFVSVIPYPSVLEGFLPIYRMARLINYGRFFQRVETVFIIIWVSAALLYLSITFYFAVSTFKKTFNLKYYRPLILPFTIILFTLSILPPNLVTAENLAVKYFRKTSWIVTFLIVFLLLLVANYIKKRRNSEG